MTDNAIVAGAAGFQKGDPILPRFVERRVPGPHAVTEVYEGAE